MPEGKVVIYDDDHYYLGTALALRLRGRNVGVTMVTPENTLAGWSDHTNEHRLTMKALLEAGVKIITARSLSGFETGVVELACVFSEAKSSLATDYLVPISARVPNDALWEELDRRRDEFNAGGGLSLQRIGDCRAPGIIAAAVYAGHKAARELGQQSTEFKRDRVVV
jgi:dimethylamine/trimethylamine dehydrogenase